jgi:hypothetical protein
MLKVVFLFGGKQTNTTRRQREDEGIKEGKREKRLDEMMFDICRLYISSCSYVLFSSK